MSRKEDPRRFAPRAALRRHWKGSLYTGLLLLAAVAGASLGFFMRFDLPDIRALEDYRPPLTTRVYAADGALLHSFAEQHRMLIGYADIPDDFRNGLFATEDSSFPTHTGIDVRGIARAAWNDLRSRRLAQGASTLTQQLARNLFLHRDKTIRRKVEEVLLALEIERQYTKQEILRFYCNQIYMGHGRYGLEAAARYYFGIPAREVSLTQAATLVGLIQRPEALSPVRQPQRALERRNHVLRRMVGEGYLEADVAAEALREPLDPVGAGATRGRPALAPYFVEEVRRWLQERFGGTEVYNEGYEVVTTLDPQLQEMANRAVDIGLRGLDKRQGWRGVTTRVPDGEDVASWAPEDWSSPFEPGQVRDAVVLSVERDRARVRLGEHELTLGREQVEWTEKRPGDLFRAGDVIRVRIDAETEDGFSLMLDQDPIVEGALIVLDPSSGAIRALVGGFDFERSEFNRAIQARRQTGSSFKPFVYAAALGAGWSLSDTVLDEPTVFLDPAKPEPYQPENYSNRYYGKVTLRHALERSANIATVKLLDEIGYAPVIDTARRLGITGRLRPFPSLALGAFETSLVELTAAYGVFANEGVLVEPIFVREVRDQEDAVIAIVEPDVRDAVSPQIAYLMNRLLSGVITDGTGRSAASLGFPIAGKTGTTDDYTDAWFIGYAPGLAVGAWVGFDEPKPLGEKETGATAALPIWRAFMSEALAVLPARDFEMPAGISVVRIDRRTGLRENRSAYCRSVYAEVFLEGTEPTGYCSVYEHQHRRLPHPFQRHALNERGELVMPADELDDLLASEPALRLVDGGRRIELHLPTEIVGMPIEIVAGRGLPPQTEDPRLEEFEPETWVGKDGRPARIQWMNGRRSMRAGR